MTAPHDPDRKQDRPSTWTRDRLRALAATLPALEERHDLLQVHEAAAYLGIGQRDVRTAVARWRDAVRAHERRDRPEPPVVGKDGLPPTQLLARTVRIDPQDLRDYRKAGRVVTTRRAS